MYMIEHSIHDDSAHREHAQHAEWEKREATRVKSQKAKEKQAMAEVPGRNKRKGRSRPNYMGMIDTDFHRIRHKAFYADQERYESIEGRMYWCIENLHICQDVDRPFNYPLRGMSAIDVGHLQKKPYFDEALHVIERMGLTQLLSIHCDYHKELILQFFSSLVMMNDDDHTLNSMSGANQCTATFRDFADALGFEFDGPNALGARF
jgi:hypothetical protein